MREYVIGLDVGTTCAKALAVSSEGSVIGEGLYGYDLISNGVCIEQKAEDWIRGAASAIKDAVAGLEGVCVGISLSTQGGSTVALDENGNYIGNALTWMDGRAKEEAAEAEKAVGGEYIYRTTGWRVIPALDTAKIAYMKKQDSYQNAKKFITTLEVVNGWLTGNDAIDPTNAAIRQIFNVEENRWDEKLLAFAGITEDQLPKILPTGDWIGHLTEEAASETGLPVGVPVYNGAHDQYCAALGAGAVKSGDMLLSAGTTWAVMGISEKPMFTDSFIAPGKHPVEGLYGAIASLICSGASLQWFKNNFLSEDFDEIDRQIDRRQEKTKDLLFYPYMAGAAYPLWNSDARGAFYGITLEHDRFDFVRAIMEGVAFGMRRAVEDFKANGVQIQKITIMGGAAKSSVWCQMIADVTGTNIELLNVADICAVGAAVIALKSSGKYQSYADAAAACVHPVNVFVPNMQQVAYYDEKFQKFDRMWNCLAQYTAK